MKRFFWALILLITIFSGNAGATQDPSTYAANCLTGGPTCLDAIDVTIPDQYNALIVLQDGDTATVITTTWTYFYTYDADSGLAESSPGIIKPDYSNGGAYSGAGRWIMTSDWTSTDKNLDTTGTIDGNFIGTVKKTADIEFNQGDAHAGDTTVADKLKVQVRADTDYTSLALAVSDIGSTPTTLKICADNVIASGTTLTWPKTLTPDFSCGGSIDGVAGGGTETIVFDNFAMQYDGNNQVFGDNLEVDGLTNVKPEWFGHISDDVIDDGVAWRAAFNSFAAIGGVFHYPDGVTVITTSGIIWPHSATECYPITIKGNNPAPGNWAVYGEGPSQMHYTGDGPLFEAMGESGTEELIFASKLMDFSVFGNDSWYAGGDAGDTGKAGQVGLHAYSLVQSTISNVSFKWFEKAIECNYRMYYAEIDRVACWYGKYGIYIPVSGSGINGTKITRCNLSNNLYYGLYGTYTGQDNTFDGNWVEGNGRQGIYLSNPEQVNLTNNYFESNGKTITGTSTAAQVYIAGSPFYNTVVTATGNHFYHDQALYSVYSMYVSGVPILSAIGNEFYSYNNSTLQAVNVAGNLVPTGCLLGNKTPEIAGYSLMQQSYMDRFITSDQYFSGIYSAKRPPTYIHMQKGDYYWNDMSDTDGVDNGGAIGWRVVVPGAGSSVTDPTVTATTSAASPTVDLSGNNTGIWRGMYIKIAGETFGTDSAAYAKVIDVVDINTITLNQNCNIGVAGAAITFNDAEFQNIYGAQFSRRTSSTPVATSGVTETTLATYTIPANTMGTNGGVRLKASGIKTTATDVKTFKLYFGATSVTVYAANDQLDWILEAELFNTGTTNAQYLVWKFISPAAIASGVEVAFSAIDTTAAAIFKLTATCANANDHVDLYNYRFDPI